MKIKMKKELIQMGWLLELWHGKILIGSILLEDGD